MGMLSDLFRRFRGILTPVTIKKEECGQLRRNIEELLVLLSRQQGVRAVNLVLQTDGQSISSLRIFVLPTDQRPKKAFKGLSRIIINVLALRTGVDQGQITVKYIM